MSPRLLIVLSPFALAVLIGLSVPNPGEIDTNDSGPIDRFSMTRYLWEARPVVVVSPSIADPKYQEAIKILNRNREPLAERGIVVFEVLPDGESRAGGRPISREAADGLRDQFKVEPDAFAIVLVGKDGSEHGRWDHLPELGDLYRLIDSMAIREREPREGLAQVGD